jgi:uncharacterized protein YbbC (DUF1343 family)/CubicO group peptidase (beta-lactamase class C family)
MGHNFSGSRAFRQVLAVFLLAAVAFPAPALPPPGRPSPETTAPAQRIATQPDFSAADAAIEQAIAADELPGAVLLVGHRGSVVYRKAYGSRALFPQREAMTADTIFDLASLTKVFATAPSVLLLMEQGKLRLADPAARYLPEFAAKEKGQITIRQLLTHTAGLPAIPKVSDGATTAQVLQAIYDAEPISPPGMRFVYSDCDFILLGEIVHRLSGQPLNEFAEKNLFAPQNMRETRFLPPAEWKPRIAPTEEVDLPEGAKAGSGRGRILRGEVHDPRARGMGGVAGHAGLFSTADDLARFCFLLLAGGVTLEARRIFSPEILIRASTAETPPWVPSVRGLGWDIDTSFSSPRGDIFPVGLSYGHTGFTGTSVWIDPTSQTFVILLGNSVHPHGRPPISSLRSKVSTAVAAAIENAEHARTATTIPPSAESPLWRGLGAVRPAFRAGQTKTGLDVLVEQQFAPLVGKCIGLITNHTGVARDGRSSIEILGHAPGVKLVALFSPEHGLTGTADEKVAPATEAKSGLPVYSLYGETRRPTPNMLGGLDALVFDVQDAGVRFYTYLATMAYAMEEAAKHHLAFYVLDRPNPLGGEAVEGPIQDLDRLNFVGYFRMPIRYGMTIGELAGMFNAENHIGADLHVIAMQDWRRGDFFESTGLLWIAPSPNLRSLDAALLYPGVELLQAGGVSVGRGTDRPFELLGAPWMHAQELAAYLNGRYVPAVHFVPTRFTPRSGLYKDQPCEGLALVIFDRAGVFPMILGLELAEALAKFYPRNFDLAGIMELLGSAATLDRIRHGDAPSNIVAGWEEEIEAFRRMRAKYLLYR